MRHIVTRMCDAIAHRGPDDTGNWCDQAAGIALGHRRLAIVELSPRATSRWPRHAAATGIDLQRRDLQPSRAPRIGLGEVPWRGHSDTETVLACCSQPGASWRALPRSASACSRSHCGTGNEQQLILARDRLGEKPLYLRLLPSGGRFLFGSELKALRAHPALRRAEVDRDASRSTCGTTAYRRRWSIYQGISKLPPGPLADAVAAGESHRRSRLLGCRRRRARGQPSERRSTENRRRSDRRARGSCSADAVRSQMVADVPLGAFLSGGRRLIG